MLRKAVLTARKGSAGENGLLAFLSRCPLKLQVLIIVGAWGGSIWGVTLISG